MSFGDTVRLPPAPLPILQALSPPPFLGAPSAPESRSPPTPHSFCSPLTQPGGVTGPAAQQPPMNPGVFWFHICVPSCRLNFPVAFHRCLAQRVPTASLYPRSRSVLPALWVHRLPGKGLECFLQVLPLLPVARTSVQTHGSSCPAPKPCPGGQRASCLRPLEQV